MSIKNIILREEKKYLKYWPVVVIYAAVFIFSYFSVEYTGGHYMSHFMGWTLILFGLLKLEDIDSFAQGFRKYDFLASKSGTYAKVYPALEVILGTLYLINILVMPITILVVVIYLSTVIGIYSKLHKGELINCLCLGTRFTLPLSIVAVIESGVMLTMALWMLSM